MEIKRKVLQELHDYQGWSKASQLPRPFSLLDYVCCIGKAELFFGFAELFCPELIIHEGRHFLAARFSREAYEAWVERETPLMEIQRVMNHVHVHTFMQEQEISDELANEVARVLAEIWSRTLRDHGLTAEVVGEGVGDAAVTFFAEKQQSRVYVC